MVATMPVSATASASSRLSKRSRTKSAAVTCPRSRAIAHSRGKIEIEERINQDRVGDGEEAHRAGAEHERGHGDEGVGGVEVAAEQEPGDHRAEAPAAEAPFLQLIEIGLAPMRGDEAEPAHEQEQNDEDDRGRDVQIHSTSPVAPGSTLASFARGVTLVRRVSSR